MTLKLVELLGHSLLGGTTLAAAGFFPPGCTRLMHALGVSGFWGTGGNFGGHVQLDQEWFKTVLHTVSCSYRMSCNGRRICRLCPYGVWSVISHCNWVHKQLRPFIMQLAMDKQQGLDWLSWASQHCFHTHTYTQPRDEEILHLLLFPLAVLQGCNCKEYNKNVLSIHLSNIPAYLLDSSGRERKFPSWYENRLITGLEHKTGNHLLRISSNQIMNLNSSHYV